MSKNYISVFMLLLCVMYSHLVVAKLSESNIKPTMQMCISPNTKEIDNYAMRLVNHAYDQLGFKVAFHAIQPGRSLILTDRGDFDGQVMRASNIEKRAPNLLKVPVTLAKGKLALYCAKDVLCDKSILNNSKKVIGVVTGDTASTVFMKDKNGSTYQVRNGVDLATMLTLKRLSYIITLEEEETGNINNLDASLYQRVILLDLAGYHYIHKKHQQLIPQLTTAFEQAIAEIGPFKKQNAKTHKS